LRQSLLFFLIRNEPPPCCPPSPLLSDPAQTHYRSLDKIAAERGYQNRDEITCSRACFGDQYEAKLAIFFEEHLHEDEEIRFVLDGSGFFDVRDAADRWVRLAVGKGDLIVLPAGIYHRFTLDDGEFIKAVRLFQAEPKWTPIDRKIEGTDDNKFRKEYVEKFVKA
jgi:1,2-dihydroxy-3-keto-5-methylthiopentene dioxygenase